MLNLEDCIALCGLSDEEVRVIAEHERIPEIAAAEMGGYLAQSADGEWCIRAMIRDDIERAEAAGDRMRALALRFVLRNFVAGHPRCDARQRAQLHLPERRA